VGGCGGAMGAVFVREVIIFIGLNLIIDGSKTTPGRFNLPYLCYKDTLSNYAIRIHCETTNREVVVKKHCIYWNIMQKETKYDVNTCRLRGFLAK